MGKTFFCKIACIVIVSLSLFSCNKDGVRLGVRMHGFGGGKVYMDSYSPKWHVGDMIRVNESEADLRHSTEGDYLEVAVADAYRAVYPAENVFVSQDGSWGMKIPHQQPYKTDADGKQIVEAPLGAYLDSRTGTLQFVPMGALLKINITNNTGRSPLRLEELVLKSNNRALWGNAQIDLSADNSRYTITDPFEEGKNDNLELSYYGPEHPYNLGLEIPGGETISLYMYIPAVVDTRFTVIVYAYDNDHRYSYFKSQNHYGSMPVRGLADVDVELNEDNEVILPSDPDGRLPGVFRVGDNKYVRFSKGNLQFLINNETHAVASGPAQRGYWRFAKEQYIFYGGLNVDVHEGFDNWFDMYAWGTSGYHDNNDLPDMHNAPWSNCFDNHGGPVNTFRYGPSTNMTDMNLEGTSANYDWGVFNAISDGGNTPGQWRTLSRVEWTNLMTYSTRALATINISSTQSVRGLIILPQGEAVPGFASSAIVAPAYSNDANWVIDRTQENNPIVARDDFWSQHTYTLAEWQAMEKEHNAVFLPAVGYRSPEGHVSTGGFYWTTTHGSESSSYVFRFGSGTNNLHSLYRCRGRGVRLVQDVPGPSAK